MARREIFRSTSKNPALFNNYQCVNCNRNHLLKDSVQPISGHWLCTCCADKLLKDSSLKCQQDLKSDEERDECFPEIGMIAHQKACGILRGCHLCGVVVTPDQIARKKCHTEPFCMGEGEVEEDVHFMISPKQATSSHSKVGHRWGGAEDSSSIRKLPDEEKLLQKGQKEAIRKVESQLGAEMLEKDKEKRTKREEADYSPLVRMNMGDVWKITQFSEKRRDGLSGICLDPLFSRPFFFEGGYKMCLQLNILADGIEENARMSLSFIIMKGYYDDIIQWPFTANVTVTLINQKSGRDIIDTFQPNPDPMSASLQKPNEEMNSASFPLFVQHSELDADGFIVDDTICIKCCVSLP
ncbi:TNF receptor-associated factor 2-like isoform X2 [Halichondria panicea]|uniref:TNF receptor-associated factor 2-like isoform X2 n=1 Tax=Halichondria panicea TaxID=6063 RepID=UPI00312BAFC8